MGEGKGWISIYRKIQNSWLWQEKCFDKAHAWIDLLLLVNHKDNKTLIDNQLIDVKRGSYVTSQRKLMKRWGWSAGKVQRFLRLLEEEGMIKLAIDKRKSTVSVVNYDRYQKQNGSNKDISTNTGNVRNENGTVTERSRYGRGTVTEPNNNDNNESNENNANKRKDYSDKAIDLCKYWQELKPGQSITSHISTLKIFIEKYSFDWTKEALQITVKNKNRFIPNYTEAILKSWIEDGKEEQHGTNKANNTGPKKRATEDEGERLLKRAKEITGGHLEDPKCDF